MSAPLRQPTWNLRELLPSGLISLILHAVLLFLATMALRGCQQGMTGETGGEVFRRVGIVDSEQDGLSEQAGTHGTEDVPSESENSLESNPVTDAESQVPAEAPGLNFPTEGNVTDASDGETSSTSDLPPLIGPGAPLSGLPPSAGGGLIQPSSSGGELDGGGSELKPGETAFLGVADSGRSFVYVIDTSSSMGEQNRLQVAKSQLKAKCFVTLTIQGWPGKRGQVPKTGTARRVLCIFGT
jgi:hypothetical protein